MSTSDREPDDRPGSPETHTESGQSDARQSDQPETSDKLDETTAQPPTDPDHLSAIPEEGTPAPPDPARAFGARPGGRAGGPRVHPSGVPLPGQGPAGRPRGRGEAPPATGTDSQHRQAPAEQAPPSSQEQGNRNPYDPRAPLHGDDEQPQQRRTGVLSALLGNRDRGHDHTRGTSGGFGGAGASGDSGDGETTTDEQRRKLFSRGRFALVLGLAAVLSSLFFPVGLLFGVPAMILGIKARSSGRRAGTVVPGAVPAVVLGAVSSVFAALMLVGVAMMWDEVTTWQSCQSAANTKIAEQRCMDTFINRVEQRFPQLQSS